MIRLTITKHEENKNYAEEREAFEESQRKRHDNYGMHQNEIDNHPSKHIEKNSLHVEITDKQFETIRKAVLEQF